MKKVVFVSGNTKTGKLLREALINNGFEIIVPDLNRMSYFSSDGHTVIKTSGRDISDATHMIYRTMKEFPHELYRLALALEGNGCHVVDGVDRLRRAIGDKSTTSMERTMFPGGIPSFIPYDESAPPMEFPVIVKPIDGKWCKGVAVCKNMSDYKAAYRENHGHVIVQQYIPFEHECRVLTVNMGANGSPEVVYVASKRNVARKGTKRKATFVPGRIERAMRDAVNNDYCRNKRGIVGYDIGYLNGRTYFIEANYAPRWDRATDKLDVDASDLIVKTLIRQT